MADNHLKLNAIKSEYILVHSKLASIPNLLVPIISVDDSDLTPRPEIRNLGINMNSILSVDDHIGMLCKSLAYHICKEVFR